MLFRSGLSGALASSMVDNLPTGPTIVLVATSIFILSVLFSPGRGIISELFQNFRKRRRIELSLVLVDLYVLNLNHEPQSDTGHSSKVLHTMNNQQYNVIKSLKMLSHQGYVQKVDDDNWIITEDGKVRALKIMNERGTLVD